MLAERSLLCTTGWFTVSDGLVYSACFPVNNFTVVCLYCHKISTGGRCHKIYILIGFRLMCRVNESTLFEVLLVRILDFDNIHPAIFLDLCLSIVIK